MKVLIGCEYSGRVRDAFIAAGHDAMSCDILPSDAPGPHYIGNVLDIINDGWDLAIFHPPCTYLTVAAEWAYSDEQKKNIKPGTLIGEQRRQAREEAIEFVLALANSSIPRIAIEPCRGFVNSVARALPVYSALRIRRGCKQENMPVAERSANTKTNKVARASFSFGGKRQRIFLSLGEPNRQRAKQRAASRRPLENAQHNVARVG